ncbi:MAG: efflux RND transporter periplasmic adaptor subunit [Pseudomonadota bacterium]
MLELDDTTISARSNHPEGGDIVGLEHPSENRKGLKRRLVVAVLVALVAIIIVIVKWAENSTSPRFLTERVRRGDIVVSVSATGTLEPTRKVDIGCEVSGTVKTIEADYNDHVKCDQVLARLDTAKFELSVAQSKAALENAKANVSLNEAKLKDADREYKRKKALHLEGAVAQDELDEKETAFEKAVPELAGAKAEVIRYQAALESAETELSKAIIRSPINGIVLSREVEPGQTVAATYSTPTLFKVAEDLTRMKLQVDVDEAVISQVKEGQEAVFTVDAYLNRTFRARTIQARFGSTTTSGVVTYKTILSVDNSDLSLRPGMTATACITVKKVENALLVPNTALRFTPPVKKKKKSFQGLDKMLLPTPPGQSKVQERDDRNKEGSHRVWAVKDGLLVPIAVTLGATDETWTEILTGDLKPDMALAIDVLDSE